MSLLAKFNRILQVLMVICISVMSVMIFINVVMRYMFNSGILVSEELSRYFFVWMTFLGAISAFIKGTHIKVDTFYRAMSPTVQFYVSIFNYLAMLACCMFIAIGCWRLAFVNMQNLLPISDIPVGILYFAGVPCGFFISLIIIVRLYSLIKGKIQGESQ